MTPSRRAAGLVLIAAVGLAACGDDGTPRRIPDDGAPCSAVMPAAPEIGQVTFRLGSIRVSERAWGGRRPDAGGDAAKPATQYYLRRATLSAGSPEADATLLAAAAARVGKGIALQDGAKPTVATVQAAGGQALELRWMAGTSRNATRVLLTPTGYCEATILGAPSDAAIASYFASVQVRP